MKNRGLFMEKASGVQALLHCLSHKISADVNETKVVQKGFADTLISVHCPLTHQ